MKTSKINLKIIISLFILMIVSALSIYASENFLKIELHNLYLKQLLFYIIGSGLIIFTTFKGFNYLKK